MENKKINKQYAKLIEIVKAETLLKEVITKTKIATGDMFKKELEEARILYNKIDDKRFEMIVDLIIQNEEESEEMLKEIDRIERFLEKEIVG